MNRMLVIVSCLAIFSCGSVSSQDAESNLGKQTYQTYCVACHGVDGKLKLNDAPDLGYSKMTLAEKMKNIREGGSMMPAFAEVISEEEIRAVAQFIEEFKTESN